MGGGGVAKILNRFVEVVGTFNERARFLEALGGIIVGVAILRLSRDRARRPG